jgi:DNA-3-methyladenine glycosylase II
MFRSITCETDIAEGVAAIIQIEPRFAVITARTGHPSLRLAEGGLSGLLRIVTEQMLSLKAADAIWRRIEAELHPFEPKTLFRKREASLMKLGLSRAKAKTFKATAKAVHAGHLDFARIAEMKDDEILNTLTAIPGIGPWTSEIFLLACLGRSDVWPAGDLALQVAAQNLLELESRPNSRRMEELAAPWQPWRAVAARLLWAHYRAMKGIPQAVS